MAEDTRHAKQYKDLYKKQQEKIERFFADVKEKYACGIQGTAACPKKQNG